ncbi:glycoside hydrolase family 15 protein [Salinibacterium sp. SYSU T00001]|uniref:glycoside hydrolase family 15 protein n=1 Tax=Homoserinimonas sedimenticola TaxID=2986805 RepID=UPI00223611C4|nr:glycoside hydrolase family 15 protein [Salinibacterium sedimenticola]MCW4384617.1 glycoside hydrolase family 15 protein [Salinibacterium sedimenticola]
MALKIEDYALIGDCHTGALVGRDGSIDWLCFPRFDSDSLFGALLGGEQHGRWLVAPVGEVIETSRRYDGDTFILVTRWVTREGEVEVTEFMPHGNRRADIVRRVRGIRGTVAMQQDLRVRLGYADAMPWVRQKPEEGGNALIAVAGPDAVVVRGPHLAKYDHAHRCEFEVSEGDTVDISLMWFPSHREVPPPLDVDESLEHTRAWWNDWAGSAEVHGRYADAVMRSLLVLKALTHEDTGGIVAAATTSLPEHWGGVRNWDYRFVWLRDASQTLEVLVSRGFRDEVLPWRGWLLRAIAGDPADIQIMYGLSGERVLTEHVIDSLPGYEGASPVRRGNGAYGQYQGDVFGELMIALQKAREIGIEEGRFSWPLQRAIMSFVEENWQRPDNGIWEIRGPLRHFTHSRVMLWAAFDSAIKGVREHGLDGPVERWERCREEIRHEIEEKGFDEELGSYTQHYGSKEVDASLLQLAQVGYVDYDDERMLGTVAQIEKQLMRDGLLLRYRTEEGVDGLPPGEHPFLVCSFWLVEQYALGGRLDEARQLMDRLVSYCNDVGLLSEEYDVELGRQVGNTPQALSHLGLVRAAGAIEYAGARPDRPELATVSQGAP